MPIDPATPSLSNSPIENTEIISKAMIRALSYRPLAKEGALPYPLSRTDRGVSWESWDRRGRLLPRISERDTERAAGRAQGSQAPTQALPRWMQATCVASSLTAQPCCSA